MIGSISNGTMRAEDLIPTFADTLRALAPTGAEGAHHRALADECDALDFENGDQDEIDFILNEDLFDALNEYADPFCYFGSHPGDGADYGFWVDIDAVEEAIRDGELLKVNDYGDIPLGHTGLVVFVSDHGNMTLYQSTPQAPILTEIWGVV